MLTSRQLIIALAIKHNGDWKKIYADIQSRNMQDLDAYYVDTPCITILDAGYPEILKQSAMPPFVLFFKGDINLLNARDTIAILGNREPSEETKIFTRAFVDTLNQERVIVSPLSVGTSTIATESALEHGNKVIAMLGSGIDYCYPASNKGLYDRIIAEGGLIVSEYPSDTMPTAEQMPARNRIIAAFADNICSMQATGHTSIIMTLTMALTANKKIFAKANYQDASDFNNRILDEGAYVLTLATAI